MGAIEKVSAPSPWTTFFPAAPGSNKVRVPVMEAGTYTLVRVAGDLCEGIVRSPEVCRVVEVPLPRAEVEVQRIHEWYVLILIATDKDCLITASW